MRRLKQHVFYAGILLIVCGISFTASAQGSVADIEGNKYKTITIGNQEWIVENLRTTKFNDGTAIPNITDKKEWVHATSSGYIWYDNEISNKTVYGGLYNWQAVETGKLCPQGWCVPTDDDWTALCDYLGKNENVVAALETAGFSIVSGGYRYGYYWGPGTYHEKDTNGYWWTSTATTETHVWSRTISRDKSKVYRSYFEKNNGFAVRCIKCEQ